MCFNKIVLYRPDIAPIIMIAALHGNVDFGKGATPDLRRRRKRQNTERAGLVMHGPYKAGEFGKQLKCMILVL